MSEAIAGTKRGDAGPGRGVGALWIDVALVAASLAFIIPILLIFITSFKPEAEIHRYESLLPKDPVGGWNDNYRYLLDNDATSAWQWVVNSFQGVGGEAPILRWLLNSLFISTCVTLSRKTSGPRKSFQLPMKTKIPSVASAGRAMGSMMFQ